MPKRTPTPPADTRPLPYVTSDPAAAWQHALELAGGDASRLVPEPAGSVLIVNPPEGGRRRRRR